MLTIMTETDDRTLVVKATKTLSSEDYEDIFIPELNRRLNKTGKIRAAILFDSNFQGWQPGAAWDDFTYGMQHRRDFEKIAVVTEKQWLARATKIGSYFMDGQVVAYAPAEFQEAVSWARQ